MVASRSFSSLIEWLWKTFGKDIGILVRDKLQTFWQRVFASKNILILGAKETGKTALLFFMKDGRPYEIVSGEIRPPNPTAFGAVVLNEKISNEL